MGYWKKYKYKNLTFLFVGFVVAFFLFRNETFHTWLHQLNNLGYVGAFIGGLLFSSTFTLVSGALILLVLAETLSPIEIGIIAGLGGVTGDLLILRFVQDNLIKEIKPIYKRLGGGHFTKVLHTPYFSWTLPVLGALIIASPLPDEIGVSLMGIAHMPTWKFILISFIFNALGIFLILSASAVIKP